MDCFKCYFNQDEKWTTKSIKAEYNLWKELKSEKKRPVEKEISPDSSSPKETENEETEENADKDDPEEIDDEAEVEEVTSVSQEDDVAITHDEAIVTDSHKKRKSVAHSPDHQGEKVRTKKKSQVI